jgi:Sporulation and spore germination
MTGHRWVSLGAGVLLVAAAGCGVSSQTTPEIIDDANVPFDLLDPDAEPMVESPGERVQPVQLCFISDNRIVLVERPLDQPVTQGDALAALAEPPETGTAIRTAVNEPDLVRSVDTVGGIARVDLRRSTSNLGGDDQLLAVAQIVCTLTHRPGIGQVTFTVDGVQVDVPRADGSLVSEPVSADDYASLFADDQP